jgi:hypothetical protein
MIAFEKISVLAGGRPGTFDVACPACGPTRRAALNRKRRVMRIWRLDPGFASYFCARCGLHGYAHDDQSVVDRATFERLKIENAERDKHHFQRQLNKARWLWCKARPASGTCAETYLRSRRIDTPLPATIRFLGPRKPGQHAAMIVPYGLAEEPDPGLLEIADGSVGAVHLTLLQPDGSGKADIEPNKITVGSPQGLPLVLAPMSDMLGLAICEGVEDALSAFQATGLGAWAAGSAPFLPLLADAVPDYVDCVTICADDDRVGRISATELAARLRTRDLHVELIGTFHRR